jgi:hypothetical protein
VTRPVLFWGLLMVALAAIGVLAFDPGDWKFAALMFGIGVAMVLLAGVLFVGGWGEPPPSLVQAIPDLSLSTLAGGIGLVLAALGTGGGLWLVLIGAGVALAGGVGVLRELRAQRRAVR